MKNYLALFLLLFSSCVYAQEITVHEDAIGKLSRTAEPLILKKPTPPKKVGPKPASVAVVPLDLCVLDPEAPALDEVCLTQLQGKQKLSIIFTLPAEGTNSRMKRDALLKVAAVKADVRTHTGLADKAIMTFVKEGPKGLVIQ